MLRLVTSLFLTLSLVFSAQGEENDPQLVVKAVSDVVLAEILANKPQLEAGPEFLTNLIEQRMIPIIDQQRMAKMALGKHWKTISEQQQAEFIAGFKRLLIKTYAGAFKAYTGQEVSYGDTKFNKSGKKAIVSSAIQMPGSTPIRLQYRLYLNKAGKWQVYDANIAGLGLLKTYKVQFAEQIQRDGVEKTIADLNSTSL